ncbi:hypothetical protein MMC34_006098 [Xylographa carneopallida]|nr:hypothetical protein [Xylographa carneopallida]
MYSPRILPGGLPTIFRLTRSFRVPYRPSPRPFTQKTQLLLVYPTSPRPRLPFLHSPSNTFAPRNATRNRFRLHLSRFLTTERKTYIKEQAWVAAKYTAYGWIATALLATMLFGIENERLERKFPSPSEWTWMSRWLYRSTRGEESPQANGSGLVDWAKTGQDYQRILARLEDTKVDGRGLRPSLGGEGDISIVGVGNPGFDISSKSEPWRRGYYECLMGAARAAEHLDTWVRDKTRNVAFPPEVIIGPSNPYPKPVPYGAKTAPSEENCEPAFESPEHYYMQILTTHGFSSRQRLDAALSYADWLEFKGLPSSAEDVYDWGLDIALGAVPLGVNNVVDINTGVINQHATYITPNILLATTALARHHALNQNLSTALAIFLSILRAQRNLAYSSSKATNAASSDSDNEASLISLFASFARSLLISPSYPDAPASGDYLATRTPTTMCEEAATMAHIGEILFASPTVLSSTFSHLTSPPPLTKKVTSARSSGLAWTRDAVTLAEQTLHSLSDPTVSASSISARSPALPPSSRSQTFSHETMIARQRCTECLLSSMQNWKLMVAQLGQEQVTKRGVPHNYGSAEQGWFWRGGSVDVDENGQWDREAAMVEAKSKEVSRLVKEEGCLAGHGLQGGNGLLGLA